MALLDAVPCMSDGVSNCYTSVTAKSAGIAITLGNIYSWDGSAWVSGSNYLIDDRNSLISEIITADKKWAIIGAPTIGGKSSNNLYYDNGNSDMNRPTAIALCTNKGMRLPHPEETAPYGIGYVPSYLGYTWSDLDNGGVGYWVWNGLAAAWQASSLDSDYVRCVR